MGMQALVADRPPSAREPWRRRLVASLLYGRGVDRAAKTRARIALTVLIFALGLCGHCNEAGDVRDGARRSRIAARHRTGCGGDGATRHP